YAQAGLRILLSDTAAELTRLPTSVTATAPVDLSAAASYGPALMQAPLARSHGTPNSPEGGGTLPTKIYKSANAPMINGFLKIEAMKNDGTYIDVTNDILSLGIAGRNLADNAVNTPSQWPITAPTA